MQGRECRMDHLGETIRTIFRHIHIPPGGLVLISHETTLHLN
jgi:hypothetical protein